ncbi:nucleoside/nucleotide kinase family protein [Yinghuangia aomiensis]
MDGFHLSNEQLARIGWLERKGAPRTFDAWGYAALLGRLVSEPGQRRASCRITTRVVDQPIAARHVVAPSVRLVVAEGNYLAVDAPEWRAVRRYLDVLQVRRCARRGAGAAAALRAAAGRRSGCAAARDWVERSDRPNGEVVKGTSGRCDQALRVGGIG